VRIGGSDAGRLHIILDIEALEVMTQESLKFI
jgi:hypothetical protein